MSGVWVFKNGVIRLVENPANENAEGRRKVLVHKPSNDVMSSYAVLERKLTALGWERYYDDVDLYQFHKRNSIDLISLPKDFNKFRTVHMYDIVVKCRNTFEVRDM
ncbi:Flowering-promoting factor 1-like protein 1 [Ranunculus cassubicifolius]